jgi:HPt (histidine-containing phosphotransfer) domain-containing protein
MAAQITAVPEGGNNLSGLESLPRSWPQGLEIDLALARMGGNRGLLQRSISAFVANAQHVGGRLKGLLDSGSREDAKRELHAFKGLAATLGAPALSELAAKAEHSLADQPRTFIDGLLADMERQLESVLPDMESVAATLAPAAAAGDHGKSNGGDKSAIAAGLQSLLKALKASDMEAMVLHAELRQKVDNSLAQDMVPLDNAMAELELDAAAVECEQLLQQLLTK